MSTYNAGTAIESLPASSEGIRRVKEQHISVPVSSIDERVESLTRTLFAAGGVAELGTITDAGTTVRVQGRSGISGDRLIALYIVDETIDLAAVAVNVKCRVVIRPLPVIQNLVYSDPSTGQTMTHALVSRLGKLDLLIGTTSVYPVVPIDAVTVGQYTRTAGGITRDLLENSALRLRRPALALPAAVTVTASPFTRQNLSTTDDEYVIVSGGTVSLIEFSRDGTTFFSTGQTAGTVSLSPADRVRVTYTVAPTMTSIPR